jgi:hypothetical protein
MVPHLYVLMDIMVITHTRAHLTATMAQIGSTAACSLGPVPGSVDSAEDIGGEVDTAATDAVAMAATGEADMDMVGLALTDGAEPTGALTLGAELATPGAADTPAAGQWHEDPLVVGSAEVLAAGSLAAAAVSMEAVVSTAVADSTAAGMVVVAEDN